MKTKCLEETGSPMQVLQEFRNADLVHKLAAEIRRRVTRPWVLMEICGGQTHAILQYGLDQLLPAEIELVHGPGCPVCVTPLDLIDKAIAIASLPNTILCSYGDMLRVPGSQRDLFAVRAPAGGCKWSILPWMLCASRKKIRIGRSFSLPSGLRPLPHRML